LALKTLIVYLEIAGILKAKYSFFAEYKFKLLLPEEQLLDQFKGERQTFLQAILNNSQHSRVWSTLDLEKLQSNYPSDRQRVIVALDYLHEKGWLELESKQMTDVYQILNSQFDINELAERLSQKFKQKEQNQIHRLKEMLALFQSSQCISQQLAVYFSDQQLSQPCGHCSVCLGQHQPWPEAAALPELAIEQLQSIAKDLNHLVQEHFKQDASIDLLSRYLCGITVPWLTKIKARKLGYFGRYEQYSYEAIRASLNQLERL